MERKTSDENLVCVQFLEIVPFIALNWHKNNTLYTTKVCSFYASSKL